MITAIWEQGVSNSHYLKNETWRQILGKKPGLVVRAEGSCPRGLGIESNCILDGCKQCY
jgi:hypothetical protein